MTSVVRFPQINTQSVYAGKIKDWSPQLRAAGKLTGTGDTTELCMKPTNKRPESPDVVRRFRASLQPEAGRKRIFYGKAGDPHLQWADNMAHGVSTQSSENSGVLLNPKPKTLYRQRLEDRKEDLYASHIRAPLGKSHDQSPGLPVQHTQHPDFFTFGIATEIDIGASGLINPDKNYQQVEDESAIGHKLYVKTHMDYDVGERINRSYTCPNFNPDKIYGIPTPHCENGREVRQTLKWLQQDDKMSKIVSERVDNFRERTQPQLGKVHDPIKDTLKVPHDHTFGVLLKADEYGAGDLLHDRFPGSYLRGKDQQRGILAAARQHLKKANYHHFPDLLAAFRFYDKDNCGKISISGLREVCVEFNLPLAPEILEQVFDYCDVNRDGLIDYIEFANFLNWKDKMDLGIPYSEDLPSQSSDFVQKSPQSSDSTARRLKKQIDIAVGNHKTSAGMINAVVGGVSSKDFRTYGVPTIRIDLAAPRIKRICDHKNYGDESNSYGLLNPSIYSQKGVYEKDFLIPRSFEEIKSIFENIGVRMTGQTYEDVYNMAASRHPKGHVSVESFRNILDELQESQLQSGNHPLAI
ncbi:hypothetical protein SNE40_022627 [Patella caerulea]|uniref:EF-hand domain-containing protein n=1 Tax=Patella caerulea TaxID=87958 RepID=A0AAN8IZS8_PATCE